MKIDLTVLQIVDLNTHTHTHGVFVRVFVSPRHRLLDKEQPAVIGPFFIVSVV